MQVEKKKTDCELQSVNWKEVFFFFFHPPPPPLTPERKKKDNENLLESNLPSDPFHPLPPPPTPPKKRNKIHKFIFILF